MIFTDARIKLCFEGLAVRVEARDMNIRSAASQINQAFIDV
jgi:hypothetical protein